VRDEELSNESSEELSDRKKKILSKVSEIFSQNLIIKKNFQTEYDADEVFANLNKTELKKLNTKKVTNLLMNDDYFDFSREITRKKTQGMRQTTRKHQEEEN
jgi:hypothetical protein